MAKKKNPEQEAPLAEEREETLAEETAEETQEQEEAAETEETSETDDQEETEDLAEEADRESAEEETQEDREPEAPAQEQPATDEVADLRRQLLEARGQNAAYAAGVAPGMVDDAVTLAMAEAAKSGEVTEAAVTKAMEAVLKRHPEWKAAESNKQKGGFKLGTDRDSGGTYKKPAGNQNVKRWNRFK